MAQTFFFILRWRIHKHDISYPIRHIFKAFLERFLTPWWHRTAATLTNIKFHIDLQDTPVWLQIQVLHFMSRCSQSLFFWPLREAEWCGQWIHYGLTLVRKQLVYMVNCLSMLKPFQTATWKAEWNVIHHMSFKKVAEIIRHVLSNNSVTNE